MDRIPGNKFTITLENKYGNLFLYFKKYVFLIKLTKKFDCEA